MQEALKAIGLAVLVFFAVLWGVERVTGIGRVVRDPADPVLRRMGRTFAPAGWLAVVATGLATLALMLGPGWDFLRERTSNWSSAATVCGFVWLLAYGLVAIVLNACGVCVNWRDGQVGSAADPAESVRGN